MEYTTFDRKLWNMSDFETIGYDKSTMTLVIELLNGETRKHKNVPENIVFEFIIAPYKEAFYKEQIMKDYPYLSM